MDPGYATIASPFFEPLVLETPQVLAPDPFQTLSMPTGDASPARSSHPNYWVLAGLGVAALWLLTAPVS